MSEKDIQQQQSIIAMGVNNIGCDQRGATFQTLVPTTPSDELRNQGSATDTPTEEEAVNETTTKNVIDRIHDGVCAVYDAGIVQNDYEWASVYKAIEEIKAFDRFSYTEFVELLKDSGRFAEGELPSASSISKITIKGEYPNWKVYDKGYKVNRQILDVGKCFFESFNKG